MNETVLVLLTGLRCQYNAEVISILVSVLVLLTGISKMLFLKLLSPSWLSQGFSHEACNFYGLLWPGPRLRHLTSRL